MYGMEMIFPISFALFVMAVAVLFLFCYFCKWKNEWESRQHFSGLSHGHAQVVIGQSLPFNESQTRPQLADTISFQVQGYQGYSNHAFPEEHTNQCCSNCGIQYYQSAQRCNPAPKYPLDPNNVFALKHLPPPSYEEALGVTPSSS